MFSPIYAQLTLTSDSDLCHIVLLTCDDRVNIAYTLIGHVLLSMGAEGPLEHFTSGDVGVAGIRDNIVDDISTKLIDNWTFNEINTWTKQSIEDFSDAVQDTT